MERLAALRNRPGGFWVAGTDPTAAHHSLTGRMPIGAVESVVLLSDGASRLVDTFGLATWAEAAQLAQYDPHRLVQAVRDAEAEDEDCLRWPRSKPHDDATVSVICRGASRLRTPDQQ